MYDQCYIPVTVTKQLYTVLNYITCSMARVCMIGVTVL